MYPSVATAGWTRVENAQGAFSCVGAGCTGGATRMGREAPLMKERSIPLTHPYPFQFLQAPNPAIPGTFPPELSSQATAVGLTAKQIVGRATALSCGGCHQPSIFGLTAPGALGPASSGLERWPASAGFVHVNETSPVTLPTGIFGPTGAAFQLSDALNSHFLPDRKTFVEDYLAEDNCACPPKVSAAPLPESSGGIGGCGVRARPLRS